jgi:electron transfer flavoprotein alpha subunit
MSKILVLAEHEDGKLKLATLSAVAFARSVTAQAGGSFQILVIGENLASIAEPLGKFGAATVLLAEHAQLKSPVADKYAHVITSLVRKEGFDTVVGTASTFSKDILPRAAALLDAAMLSDVVEAKLDGGDFIFKRVMFAGNVIATVKLDGPIRFFSVRAAAFAHPPQTAETCPIVPVSIDEASLPNGIEHVARETKMGGRPDSTEARVVVSGGRAIKNAEDFERLIGGLADALGGAVGSSRALVDAGVTPNSLQVGQTGKIVAPELYIAVGISGAIQHLAGMKDTKVIVGINKDADAPIFEVADFGLVGDAYQVVPELVAKLKKN